ncbi:MAG: D-alanyl-D-alanine carboxypeptidase DacB precursor [Pelotomaculum sp. PtaB.Bin104]|nr:MAG: D-alanyl-D-alanine carboxypeptidase DacB precursor [Pelotomaculum sp. PtaB.Bin104]
MHYQGFLRVFFVILLLMFVDLSPAFAGPEIVGQAAILIDSKNGQVLFEKNSHQRMYPASTTKTLTAIVALENFRLSEVVTIPPDACNIEGSAIGLQAGEKISMESLLYAMLLNSGNDSATAIASHLGGSVAGFVGLMNEKAAGLGAVNTHFKNPSGLPDPEHYTTAYDLSLIARYAMQNQEFRKIVATKTKNIQRADPQAQTYLLNHNKLLWKYEGAIGIKTGYTDAARQCLLAAAVRDGRELIAVVLGSEGNNIWSDTIALLDYGFSNFEHISVVNSGSYITEVGIRYGISDTVPALAGQSLTFNVPLDQPLEIRQEVRPKNQITAPVETGDELGEVIFYNGEQEIGKVSLVSRETIPKKVLLSWWPWVLAVAALFTLLAIVRYHSHARRRRVVQYNRRKYYV